MKWWRWYRSAIRDMGDSDIPGFSGRARSMLVFVLPLGLLCMAVLFVGQIVEDPSRLRTLDGFRRLGGIALMAGIFVGMGAAMIAMYRSEERKRQRLADISLDAIEAADPVTLSGDATFEISRRRTATLAALVLGTGIVAIFLGDFWVLVGVVGIAYSLALAIGLLLGPVRADARGIFHPFQWYLGRLKWDRLQSLELNSRGIIVLRRASGRSLYISFDDLDDGPGFIAFVKATAGSRS